MAFYTPDTHFAVEEMSPVGSKFICFKWSDTLSWYTVDWIILIERIHDIHFILIDLWSMFRDYEHIRKHNEAKVTNLDMKPGRSYRVAVKLCAITTCYEPLYSDGVMILSSPPTQGKITVEHQNISLSGGQYEKVRGGRGLVLKDIFCNNYSKEEFY